MRRYHLSIRLLTSLAVLLVVRGARANVPRCDDAVSGRRIVAIGDVHGSLAGLRTMLEEAGLLNSAGEWVGGKTVFIQTGDLLDRGPDELQVMELAIDLEAQASRAGGEARFLLGNHEVMNLFGDLRYVPESGFSKFADADSEKRREKGFRQYQRFLKAQARFLGQPAPEIDDALRQRWYDSHPPGYLERREAFSPGGRYGKWLRDKEAVSREAGFIFLHGGLDPTLPADIAKINSVIRDEIRSYDQIRKYLAQSELILEFHDYSEALQLADSYIEHLRLKEPMLADEEERLLRVLEALSASTSWLSVHPDGPLWYRGYARWRDPEGDPLADGLLAGFGACGLVVGHSPQVPGGIQARFGGKIYLIDSGMLVSLYKGGVPSALLIEDDGIFALYPEAKRVRLADPPLRTVPDPESGRQNPGSRNALP